MLDMINFTFTFTCAKVLFEKNISINYIQNHQKINESGISNFHLGSHIDGKIENCQTLLQ